MKIIAGFTEQARDQVAAMFWQAFRQKLKIVMGPDTRALEFIAANLSPDHALSALSDTGELLGVAGFKTGDGALLGGELADMQKVYGYLGGMWRGLLLSTLERPPIKGQLLMDGIFVAEKARGKGVGSALLQALFEMAPSHGCHEVRLDVIDINPKARALYERQGFVATQTQSTGPLKYLFGFSKSTTMLRQINVELD